MRLPADLALRCAGCGARSDDPLAFRCPDARPGDDIDHVLQPPEPPADWRIDDGSVATDSGASDPGATNPGDPDGADPFLRYRRATFPWRLWTAAGGDDDGYVGLLHALDDAVAAVDGRGFRITPLRRPDVDLLPGVAVWVKDDTVNVSGSHKGRHLMGLALYLAVLDRLHTLPDDRPPLAIASCGNAALAAAVVAHAARWPLRVFVPPWAAPSTLARLGSLGAAVQTCERRAEEIGDPCYLRFREAIDGGALPFAAQGPENGLTIDGGATLGYELAEQHPAGWDRLAVQVGGGALATSVWTGLRRMARAGRLARLPRLLAVQAEGGHPLVRALRAIQSEATTRGVTVEEVLDEVGRRRSAAMWPWGGEPHSVASGILDDETYDWRALLGAVVASGGDALAVDEATLERANALGRSATGIDVDHTGTAGLAGLLAAADRGEVPAGSSAVVLFTGARR